MAHGEKPDPFIPWGIYTPPSNGDGDSDNAHAARGREGEGVVALPHEAHGGYVRVVDAKGKFFPCAFSRPVGYVMEAAMVADGERGRSQLQPTADENPNPERGDDGTAKEGKGEDPPAAKASEVEWKKRTLSEERLHPEEALFLHMRGLLRIESNSVGTTTSTEVVDSSQTTTRAMSTHDLFCRMLPDCNVPLAAYLAYAHLRVQGYILMRYTDQRMRLLREVQDAVRSTKLQDVSQSSATVPDGKTKGEEDAESLDKVPNSGDCEAALRNDNSEQVDDSIGGASRNPRLRTRPPRLKLSDDVAAAPPPFIASHESEGRSGRRISYYAYNPNARFGRTNPGPPDFGVAVMSYHSGNGSGPTFGDLKSLLSFCEEGGRPGPKEDADDCRNCAERGIPLRVVTVADSGAVIAFGLTSGEVPSTNQANK